MAGRMIRQKKVWVCSNCKTNHLKWQGFCKSCKASATLQEKILRPEKEKPRATTSQKSLMRRHKTSERNIARRMLEVDGEDPDYHKITSSTGRVGHITGMRIDAISQSYVTENKNRVLPKWVIDAWILVLQKSKEFNKEALYHHEPPNMPKDYIANGIKYKTDTIAMITQTRHEALIIAEQQRNQIAQLIDRDMSEDDLSDKDALNTIRSILRLE